MEYKGFTYTPTPKTAWDNLSMLDKSEMMKVAVRNGITDLKTIKEQYNEFAEGGGIHIKDSKKGTFTAAASRHNMGVQEFASKVLAHPENYSLAMRRKANFARNASKWHGEGGNLFDGTSEGTQQMQICRPFWQSQTQEPSFMESLAEFNRQQEIKKQQQRQALREKINAVGKRLADRFKYDDAEIKTYLSQNKDNEWAMEMFDPDMFPTTGGRRKIGDAFETLSNGFKKAARTPEFKFLKPLEDKMANLEVGNITGGKPFLVQYDIPFTTNIRFTDKDPGIVTEQVPGFISENLLPQSIFNWKHGIATEPANINLENNFDFLNKTLTRKSKR